MAAELAAAPQPSDTSVPAGEPAVTAALMQRLLEAHVRAQLDRLADIRPGLG